MKKMIWSIVSTIGMIVAIICIIGVGSTGANPAYGAYLDGSYSPAFNATGKNFFTIPDNPSLHTETFSLASWFKTSKDYVTNGIIANRGGFGLETEGNNLNYGLWIDAGEKLRGGFETASGTDVVVISVVRYNDSNWHYAVVTYDGAGILKLYVDGNPVGTLPVKTPPDSTSTNPLRIGANSQANNKNFQGAIDEVRVWDRALPALEILDQFSLGIIDSAGELVYMDGISYDASPIAKAGSDRQVQENAIVSLNGAASFDPYGDAITSYSWSQLSGPSVTLSNKATPKPVFKAPALVSDTTLTFSLTVSDGHFDDTDMVVISVINTNGGYNFQPNHTLQGTQYIDLLDSPSLKLLTYSIGIWFKTTSDFTSDAYLVNKGGVDFSASAGKNLNYGIWMDSAERVKGGFESTSGFNVFVTSSQSYSDGNWHYAVLTCNCPTSGSTALKLFMDGQEVATTAVSNKPDFSSSLPVRMGAHGEIDDGTRYFTGSLDELRIWNRVLTQNEIVTQSFSGIYDTTNQIVHVDMSDVPIVDAGQSQLLPIDTRTILSGSGTTDGDNDPLTYQWSQLPGSSVVNISNSNSVSAGIKTYHEVIGEESAVFLLRVSDDKYVATDTVNVVTYDNTVKNTILQTPQYRNEIIADIRNAKTYIYTIMYYVEVYNDSVLFDELESAVNRGIDVKLMFGLQSASSYPTIEQDLQTRGIPYKFVGNHAKVVIIDDKAAYVGSANWNNNGLENNWEISLKTTNPNTIAEAKGYLLTSWSSDIKKQDTTDRYYERFANGKEFYDLLLQNLKEANSVKVLMFEMTYSFQNPNAVDTKVLNELKNAMSRGADLQILLDNPTYNVTFGGKQFLTQYNISHKLDDKNQGFGERMHAKAILIDDEVLFIGSQNWNIDSLSSTGEAAVITRNSEAISQFQTIFDGKWNLGSWVISGG